MNQIYIGPQNQKFENDASVFTVPFETADKHLAILRSDYFSTVHILLPENVSDKDLKFMMYFSRILKKNGAIKILNKSDSASARNFASMAKKIGLFQINNNQNTEISFVKTKPENEENKVKTSKLAIGFKSLEDEEIDEDELMQNEGLNIKKEKAQNCAEKPRACANCNCGRKDAEQPVVSKEQLVNSVNIGKPVSGCGKCYLGDSFRCGSCPYKGMPAFKPGDKLKLVDEGQVVVETGEVKVEGGKVKLQL